LPNNSTDHALLGPGDHLEPKLGNIELGEVLFVDVAMIILSCGFVDLYDFLLQKQVSKIKAVVL